METPPSFPVAYKESAINKGAFYFAIIFFGLMALFMISVLIEMFFDEQKTRDIGFFVFGFLVCAGIPMAISLFFALLLRKQLRVRQEQRQLWVDNQLIRLCQYLQTPISVPDIMLNLTLNAEEAKTAADRLQQKGVLEIQITPSGAIVYRLSGFDKQKAEDV